MIQTKPLFFGAILWFWDSLILKCRSVHLLFYWILFENVMSLHRTKATFIGLLEAGRANEWVVTEKLGDALKNKSNSKAPKRPLFRIGDRWEMLKSVCRVSFSIPVFCFHFTKDTANWSGKQFLIIFANFAELIWWSWDSERSSSSADATIFSMGSTITSFTSSSKH